jgi:hypothetical protein
MAIENKVLDALTRITSQKEMDALFRKLAFEEYQATMENSEIEVEVLETQEITLVTGCEIDCTLESSIITIKE